MALSGREKATIFLSILGSDISSQVLRFLPGEVADLIASGLNHLPSPSPQALAEVLQEFNSFTALPSANIGFPAPSVSPPLPAEKKVESEPQMPSVRAVPPKREGVDSVFYASPKKLSYVLAHERPELMAFILSQFPAAQRVEIISYLPVEKNEIEKLVDRVRSNMLSDKIRDKLFKVLAKRISNL